MKISSYQLYKNTNYSCNNVSFKQNGEEISSKKLINKFFIQGKISPIDFVSLQKISKQSNNQNNNITQVLNLVDKKLIHPKSLKFISQTGELSQNIQNNINKTYIPTFNSIENAINTCNIGEVFEIDKTKNVFIKTDENNYKQLQLDKNTFVKLFPQIQQYSSSQNNSDDCYLISTINAILDNKYTSHYIYECFEQNENNINIKFPNHNFSYTYKNAKIPQTNNGLITGATGLKLLEHAYGRYLEDCITFNAINTQNNLIKKQKELLNVELNEKEKKNINNTISKLEFTLARLLNDRESKFPEIVIDTNSKREPIINAETGINLKSLNSINTYTHSTIKSPADYYRNNFCYMEDVFKAFGLKDVNTFSIDEEEILNILTNPNEYKNYIFVGGTKKEGKRLPFRSEIIIDKQKKLFGGHAYRIIPFKNDNNEILYKASNPWNSSHDLILTLDDLKNTFIEIDIAKIN